MLFRSALLPVIYSFLYYISYPVCRESPTQHRSNGKQKRRQNTQSSRIPSPFIATCNLCIHFQYIESFVVFSRINHNMWVVRVLLYEPIIQKSRRNRNGFQYFVDFFHPVYPRRFLCIKKPRGNSRKKRLFRSPISID